MTGATITRTKRILAFLGVILLGVLLADSIVRAHEAPTGWAYDAWCCSDRDCRRVQAGEVTFETAPAAGYRVRASGVNEFIPLGDPRIRQSGDQDMHFCIVGGGRSEIPPTVRCLYVGGAV